MSVADELLAECLATPDDDASRLVWADAIGGERGELIGLQCGRDAVPPTELVSRNRRERELLATHAMAWSRLEGLARRVRFRRGFVDVVIAVLGRWLREAASPDVTVTAPAHGELAIHPPEAAAALVEAISAPIDVDGDLVPVRLTLA